jgi:hypothetical protein
MENAVDDPIQMEAAILATIGKQDGYVVSQGGDPPSGEAVCFLQEFKLKCRAGTYEYAGRLEVLLTIG